MNILVTGGNGYIGSGLVENLSKKHYVTNLNRQILDLTNLDHLSKWIKNQYFDIVIHTAIKGGSRLSPDTSETLDHNIMMYINLLQCKKHFKKFINIGSGAEVHDTESFYGLSKKIITKSLEDKDQYYTLRVYGLFDHKELSTRFIKSNLNRYLSYDDIIIYHNKYMDFIYWDDFYSIVEYYIENNDLPKIIDCVYEDKYTLLDIANIINGLDNYKVKISNQKKSDKSYIGTYHGLGLKQIGLHEGIKLTYRKLKNEKNMVRS